MLKRCLPGLALMVVWASPTHAAYIDPGTGSMILQAAIAAIAGAGLLLRTYWHRVIGILGRKGSSKADEPEAE